MKNKQNENLIFETEEIFVDAGWEQSLREELGALGPLPEGFREELSSRWKSASTEPDGKPESVSESRLGKATAGGAMTGKIDVASEKRPAQARVLTKNAPVKNGGKDGGRGLRYLSIAAVFVACLLVTIPFWDSLGMGNPTASNDMAGESYDYDMIADRGVGAGPYTQSSELKSSELAFESGRGTGISSGELSGESDRNASKKIIENYEIGLRTDEFDIAKAKLEKIALNQGGFISSFEIYGDGSEENRRSGHFVIKIPQDFSASVMEMFRSIGEVYNESKSMEDVTKRYTDIEIEIKNYEEAERRYLELYQKADTIEDMLRIEQELGRLRNLIDSHRATLKNYDYMVSYSTIRLTLMEVIEIVPTVSVEPGVWQKAKDGFVNTVNSLIRGFQNAFVFLISIVPTLALLLIALLIIWGISVPVRRRLKRSRDRRNEEGPESRESNTEKGVRSEE